MIQQSRIRIPAVDHQEGEDMEETSEASLENDSGSGYGWFWWSLLVHESAASSSRNLPDDAQRA